METTHPWRRVEDAVRHGTPLLLAPADLAELLGDHDALIVEKNDLVGRNWRYTRIARAVHGEPEELAHINRRDFIRACGDCVCEKCGNLYHDHPRDPLDESLRVLCDMTRVHL